MARWNVGTRLLALAVLAAMEARAQSPTQEASEYQVKAAFLYNFVKFVEWPADSLNDQEKIVLCVFGKDPFQGALDLVAGGRNVNGHPLLIRRINDPVAARSCHVLFVGAADGGRAGEIMNSVRRFNVLSVTEVDRLAEQSAVINFVMDDRRVRFQINTRFAESAGLKISSKLLQLALAGPRGKR